MPAVSLILEENRMVIRRKEEIEVRQASSTDVHRITGLCHQLGCHSTMEEVKIRLMSVLENKDHIVYVAQPSRGNIIGWIHAHIQPLLHCSLFAEIGGVVIDKDYRRAGVGMILMEMVENWARDKGCLGVNLSANVLSRENHMFYEHIGYKKLRQQVIFCKRF